MIKSDLLKNHPDAIPALTNIWHEVFEVKFGFQSLPFKR